MRLLDESLVLSPTDLAGFLACRHRTALDLAVVRRVLTPPTRTDAYAAILQRLGQEHEARYVASLRASGSTVADLSVPQGQPSPSRHDTVEAMRAGVDVIVQARLESADLAGYADVLIRVDTPSGLGAWSYEVQDTKLARETKGGTILQLSAYSSLLAGLQARTPEFFHVVTPPHRASGDAGGEADGFHVQTHRVEDYAGYFRMVLASLRETVRQGHEALLGMHYPDPVDMCEVCRWERRCLARRRADDHLSFIAGIGRVHRVELTAQGHSTLALAAALPVPVPFTPARGARDSYNRLVEQARVQQQQRTQQRPVFDCLPIAPGDGLCRLPAPSPGDLFLDLEGARFAREGGREYLFGVWDGAAYHGFWASSDREERSAFEATVDLIMDTWARHPDMHVYHFSHYEPTAFKKLMGRHATRAEHLDQLLRAERFVDLFPVVRQAVRAGVESYSIKQLEPFTGYTRAIALASVRDALMAAELALESNMASRIAPDILATVQLYNQDDCQSTEFLRRWLETLRTDAVSHGATIPRPEPKSGDASPDVSELQEAAALLRARLLEDLSATAANPDDPDHPRWLMAYLVDFHKREENAEWWEYYRLQELSADELLDERQAIVGLALVERVDVVRNKRTQKPTGSVIDRYHYPAQDVEIRAKASLKLQDGGAFGEVITHLRTARVLDVKKGPTRAETHPAAVFASDVISSKPLQLAVMRLAGRLADAGAADDPRLSQAGLELLYRRPPRLHHGTFDSLPGESAQQFAVRIVTDLDRTTLAIQGPPGAGKTYVGAEMIRALLRAGRKVGITAVSHKVIRNLMDEVMAQSERAGESVRGAVKVSEAAAEQVDGTASPSVPEISTNDEALGALATNQVQVIGATAWLWAREDAAHAVDVLVVDEAGQMSLGNVLAVAQAAESLVLLGDPQQLEQPQKATHPDGVGVSALQYVLGAHDTMPPARGIFLPTTWRMSPRICTFTSELFYEGKLTTRPGLAAQELRSTGIYDGSHLWWLPVEHDGNQSAANEEVDAVHDLVATLLQAGACWVDAEGRSHPMTARDLRIVAPFNAQVNRLAERLGHLGIPTGTVDKFQGQTAAVVIYSMTTSRPEDAPRGMEFLYSLNRLNVATSRARCAVFLIASPRLFEPSCTTPHQMHLANALCRYREMSRTVTRRSP